MKLTQKEALAIINTILLELETRNKQANIAIVDAHGELVGFIRMEKVKLSSITIAINKSYTAARSQNPTMELVKIVGHPEKGYDLMYHGDPRFTGFGGGVPIKIDGETIGAVAVSGLSQEEDEELSYLGIKAVFGA